jgi:uncharacterized protein (TIGR01319 family)
VKRTVEGDLGMRHNLAGIIEEAGVATVAAAAGLSVERVDALAARLDEDAGHVPETPEERAFDAALARAAVAVAVRRHAGSLETIYAATGPVTVQRGKDLGGVVAVVGTGGVLAHGQSPGAMLAGALADPADPLSLRPRRPRLLVDRHYLLYAAGLLGTVAPEAAARLAETHVTPATDAREGTTHAS